MKTSAGILAYRKTSLEIEYFLVYPGGPFYQNKNLAVWTIPKGMVEEGEQEEEAAKREFKEETGFDLDNSLFLLGETLAVKGKRIIIYGVEANFDENLLRSNFFEMEYPPKLGKFEKFPEIAEGKWFGYEEVQSKIFPKFLFFIEMLHSKLMGILE